MVKNYFKLMVAILFVSNVMAQNVPSYVPKNGLVGWWPFNGNANDESGNGNHGTVNGATLTTDRNGKANSAYSFDGLKQSISINNLEGEKISTEITITLWFLSKSEGYSPICKSGSTMSGDFRIQGNSNSISFIFKGKEYIFSGFKNEYKPNSWNFISIKNNGVNSILTVNELTQINFNNGNNFQIDLNNTLFFGTDPWGALEYHNGYIDDIAIYNRALSDQEIKQLYEGCTKETATSSSFNSVVYTTNTPVNLSANPTGGSFNGEAVTNNAFEPSKAKLGKNQVKYNFKNSTGCADSTNFTMILVDTLGNKCSTYDTLKIKVQLTTGIKAGQLTSMNVYPNPASELLIIEAKDIQALGGYKYKIVDLQGKEVYNALATSARTEISLKSIGAKGMYILHIVDEKGVSIENKKIVLE